MNNQKFTIGVIAVTALLLLGGIVLATRMISTPQAEQVQTSSLAKAVVGKTTYDWGSITMSDGNAEATFTIKNDGADPLKLSNIVTSCLCTTAQLILGETQSPAFGMHNKSAYVFELPPQQEAQLKVVFDPAFHGPNGIGPIDRLISISTNDPAQPKLQFSVKGVVSR